MYAKKAVRRIHVSTFTLQQIKLVEYSRNLHDYAKIYKLQPSQSFSHFMIILKVICCYMYVRATFAQLVFFFLNFLGRVDVDSQKSNNNLVVFLIEFNISINPIRHT